MKRTLTIMGLVLVGLPFGLDERLSIEKGGFEINCGYGLNIETGQYDDEGEKQDRVDDAGPIIHILPLQLKYGLLDGLDLELATYGAFDGGDIGGFSQPQIALKYTYAPLNTGAFVNLTLPLAAGKFNKPRPGTGLGLGAMYGNRFGDFRLIGIAGYQIDTENETGSTAGNSMFAYAKPEAMWTEFIGTYLGVRYDILMDGDFDAYIFSVVPGANVRVLPWLAYEVSAPIRLLGKNSMAGWGMGASAYITLPR